MGASEVVAKLFQESPEVAKIFGLGEKASPELRAAVEKYKPGLAARMESNGSFESNSRALNELKLKFGSDDAHGIVKDAGYGRIESPTQPGRNLMFGAAAVPAGANMNPFSAAKELGQQIKPVTDAYENAKDKVAGAAIKQMNFGNDPTFQRQGTAALSTLADPVNFIPGAPGAVMQGAQMLGGLSSDAPKNDAVPASPAGQQLSLEKYAHGGAVSNLKVLHQTDTHTTLMHPDGHEIRLAHAKLQPAQIKELKSAPKYAEGGDVQQPVADPQPQASGASADWGGPAPTNVPLPTAQSPNDSIGAPPADPMAGMRQAQGLQEQGILGQAKATGDLGNKEADLAGQQQQQSADLQQNFQQKTAELDQDRQAIMHDIASGHIDPDHYLNNMSAGSKVGTAIGLLLGGLGGSATGKNPAMEYLQKQIDHDVDAQKADLGRKENLLSALQKQYGNLHDATLMAKTIYSDIYSAKIQQAAASAKTPMAQAAAQQAIGQLRAQTAPMQMEMAQRQSILEGMNKGQLSDPSVAVQHLVPKEHQKAVFDEIGKAQNTAANEGEMLKNFDTASKENTVMRTGAGLARTPPSIMGMRALSLPMIHDAEGRVNEFEAKTLNDLEPKPGDTDAKIAAKRAQLVNFMQQKKAAPTAKGFGIDLSKFRTTNPASGKTTPR